ncbi:MAG TPA: FAD-dependent oxidoreductase [Nitrososphaerales archaeon]|nr:FAD-dependent oxidoreductase [Nitrososphaerales archaeon]
MSRVLVIGGGTAGTEAAAEAAKSGNEVTVIEMTEAPEPSWRCWPDLIGPPMGAACAATPQRPQRDCSASTLRGTEVKSVGPGVAYGVRGPVAEFDFVVVATGSRFEPTRVPGQKKPGVTILDTVGRYAELGRMRDLISGVVVQGEGGHALQVSDRLCHGGAKVHLLISCWQHDAPSPAVYAAIKEAALQNGVSILQGDLSRAVGSGVVEAVVVGGEVIPCDCLVLVPRRVPRVVPLRAKSGPTGGILVDGTLSASSPSTYAAGGCAELGTGLPPFSTLEAETVMSGRIAGANATGQHITIDPFRYSEVVAFGQKWSRSGVGASFARTFGLVVDVVSRRWGPTSACTIVFETTSGRVVGVETVEEVGASSAGIPSGLSRVASLRRLAYEGLAGSSDISMVADTARLGLNQWSRY